MGQVVAMADNNNEHNRNFPLYRVDAFTESLFSGNPAGVCLINKPVSDEVLQLIAREVNLSETAFLLIQKWESLKTSDTFKIRWFTPRMEVPLCGHATLASAAVLFYELGLTESPIIFDSVSGKLSATQLPEGIELNFPSAEFRECEASRILLSALGISNYRKIVYSDRMKMLLIHLPGEDMVRSLTPHFHHMEEVSAQNSIEGVIVTAAASAPPYDFVSRFFAPWLGIDEDPVTGSAHTMLAPYWGRILQKRDLKAIQVSQRSGTLDLHLTDDAHVLIAGKAIVFYRGNIYPNGYSRIGSP
jgi:PhzF family phenazine biosynthesis protein